MWSHSLFRDTPVPLLVVAPDGRIQIANPAAATLFGRQSLSGSSVSGLVVAGDRRRLDDELARWWALAGGGSSTSAEFTLLCAEGERPGRLQGSHGVGERGPVLFLGVDVPNGERDAGLRDGLTGVDTRPRLLAMLAEHASPEAVGCVLLVDLDDFEELNTSLGVAIGDEVLVEVARRLVEAIPADAAVARWDGDAFLVLAPGTPATQAMDLGRAVLLAVSRPMDIGGTRVVTSSIGVAGLAGRDADEVLMRAAWALDLAKSGGGRQVADDGPAPRRFGRRRSDLIREIRVWESSAQSWRSGAERAWVEARTDALTGLPNRRAWDEFVAQWPDRERRAAGVAVAFVDLDEFGMVNKAAGQAGGDLVLKSVAEVIRSGCREGDLVFRHGGEEFVLVLQDTDEAGGRVVAERMRTAVEEASLAHPTRGVCTVTIGVAAAFGTATDLSEVASRANEQEKAAKRAGRNRVFPPDPLA